MEKQPKPWSVWRSMFYLTCGLAAIVLIFDKAASPSIKAAASQLGDRWIETGKLAANLQSRPWLVNLGLVDAKGGTWRGNIVYRNAKPVACETPDQTDCRIANWWE